MLNTVKTASALALSADSIKLLWQTPLLGMAMIFAVLGLLWGVLTIFKLIFVGATPAEPKPKKETNAEPPQQMAVASAPAQEQNQDELIAVLTAAIAAYRDAEANGEEAPSGFRVVSFRRTNGGRSWNVK